MEGYIEAGRREGKIALRWRMKMVVKGDKKMCVAGFLLSGRIYRSWKGCGKDSVEMKNEDGSGIVIK